jgi:fructosamine-3-kinase
MPRPARTGPHAERVGLWQLFPLLVHACLFGAGYAGPVRDTARAALAAGG